LGLLALSLYSYIRFTFWPPDGFPRAKGAGLITGTVHGVGNVVTAGMIYILVIFAVIRRRGIPDGVRDALG
jgi:hypothetical protein